MKINNFVDIRKMYPNDYIVIYVLRNGKKHRLLQGFVSNIFDITCAYIDFANIIEYSRDSLGLYTDILIKL